jgi:GPH family glycoside/pentoside/hexuronide:cation symporter
MPSAHSPLPPLSWSVKAGYGLGQIAEGVKNAGFNFFLFFFYTQVLGVNPSQAGAVLLVATVIDALTDPLMGFLSDRSTFAMGRRQPFLYASAVPMGLSFVLLFTPPGGVGAAGTMLWLLAFTVLVRTAMTVHQVPYMALGAELSDDYHERTAVVSYRAAFGALGLAGTLVLAWTVFFRSTPEHANGQLNASAYAPFALASGALIMVAILVSAAATHRRAQAMARISAPPPVMTWGSLVSAYRGVLANRSFRALLFGVLVFNTMRGVQEVLAVHMLTYFWRLSSSQILWLFLIALLALVAGVPVWAALIRRMDKRPALVGGIAVFSLAVLGPPTAQLLSAFPAEGTSLYLAMLLGGAALSGIGGAAVLVAAGSMMADVADEHELHTGKRQAGLFFGALLFATKATSGLGSLLGGIGLDMIAFPAQALPEEVSTEQVRALGLFYGPAMVALAITSIAQLWRYQISRATHARTATLLAERAAAAGTPSAGRERNSTVVE